MEKVSKSEYKIIKKNLLYLYRAELKFRIIYSFMKLKKIIIYF